MDSSDASTGAGLVSALGDNDSVDSVGFEWEWGAAAADAFGAIGAGLAFGLGLIK